MSEEVILSRQAAVDMLQLAILFIERGKTDVAINQLWFLIDNLEVAMALDEVAIFREALGNSYVTQ